MSRYYCTTHQDHWVRVSADAEYGVDVIIHTHGVTTRVNLTHTAALNLAYEFVDGALTMKESA